MSQTPEMRSVVVERDMPHPPQKIWRALTQPHLLGEWLMQTDFAPARDRKFSFSGDWGSVDCQVLEIEENRTLTYSWAAYGLESTVTWTLTPSTAGTHLRMEQAGFRTDQQQFYMGARASWPQFLTNLEQLLAGQE